MADLTLFNSIIILLGLSFSFWYSFINLIRHKRGLYYKFCVLGFFSFLIGRLYFLLIYITGGDSNVFSIGYLGTISGILFLLSANKLLLSVLEEKNMQNGKKYKFIPLIAPALLAICYVILLASKLGFEIMIIPTLLMFTSAPCSYYMLKYAILPDTENGFISCMRPFNIVAVVISFLPMLGELGWLTTGNDALNYYYLLAISVVCNLEYILLAILLERGARKWIM